MIVLLNQVNNLFKEFLSVLEDVDLFFFFPLEIQSRFGLPRLN